MHSEVDQKLLNPHGVVDGGVLYSLADTGMGGATYTGMEKDELCATIEIKIVYFKVRRSMKNFADAESEFVQASKRSSGAIRESADRLAGGLAKVEKSANFDRLERYVELLERASSAMSRLAELESGGKLEKIAAALR